MPGPKSEDAHMASQSQSAPAVASNTTATEELSRFASYVEFRTRDLRHSVAQYLGTKKSPANELRGEDDDGDDDSLFMEVGGSGEGWVSVADNAVDGPEVGFRFYLLSFFLFNGVHHDVARHLFAESRPSVPTDPYKMLKRENSPTRKTKPRVSSPPF